MAIFPARASIARRAGAAVVGVALVLALGACGSSSKPQTTAQLLQQALREHVAGDLPQAESDFIEVIRRDPKNKFAYYNLGLIYQTQGEDTDAESQYRLALTVDTKFGPALYNLAILRTAADDSDGAIDLYRQAIAANPKDASAHFNLGLLLRKAGQTATGNAEVQIAVNLDSSLRTKALNEKVPLTGQ